MLLPVQYDRYVTEMFKSHFKKSLLCVYKILYKLNLMEFTVNIESMIQMVIFKMFLLYNKEAQFAKSSI